MQERFTETHRIRQIPILGALSTIMSYTLTCRQRSVCVLLLFRVIFRLSAIRSHFREPLTGACAGLAGRGAEAAR